ncbi:MarR family transcriptional regulator [Streptomyces sp. NBC_00554]|uniref:LexA family protein n=1 Tax=unclassified Streptomyces TaxID=2593676 RepID=UPI0022597FCB|nr:MarR family transcriptional regulator [Streptomyces sp. NBC_00620]MCX4972583.1 MarR family transcriptional regulator [Streptomyces sp. NBC_00620]WUC50527.1 MarR family transcriptional regulator [Streptomyces sp. NBC_00554]
MIYPLTDRQERILRCIREWIAEHGEAPSIREIGKQVGLSSPSSVLHQLNQLEKRGLLSRERRASRASRLAR